MLYYYHLKITVLKFMPLLVFSPTAYFVVLLVGDNTNKGRKNPFHIFHSYLRFLFFSKNSVIL